MPSISIDIYWVDENGDFRVDENGNYIIWDTLDEQYTSLHVYRKSLMAQRGIQSFDITEQDNGSYVTKINKSCFLGRYGTRELALGALVNAFFCNGVGSIDDVTATMGIQLTLGRSTLEGVSIPAPVETASTSYYSGGPSFTFTGGIPAVEEGGSDGSFYRTNSELRDTGIVPDFRMDQVMGLLGESTSTAWTLLPDNAPFLAANSWTSFDPFTWNGSDPLPQLVPQEYVDYCQSVLDDGYVGSWDGVALLLDWEGGTTKTSRMGSMYWNATDTKYRAALTELRSQQLEVIEALKGAFSGILLGCYGGTCDAPASNELHFTGDVPDRTGGAVRFWSMSGIQNNQTRIDNVTQAYKDCLAATALPWDFHTHVAYDYFGMNGIAWYDQAIAAGVINSNTMRPDWRKEEMSYFTQLLETEIPDVPRLGIVSPSNFAVDHQPGDIPVDTALNRYGWVSPYEWVTQTIDFIKDMDGYFVWDNLRGNQYKNLTNNYTDWNAVANKTAVLDEWKMFEDMERRFGFLTDWATEKGVSVPLTPQDWFGNPMALRSWSNETSGTTASPSDPIHYTKNALVKDIVPDLRDTLMPLIEQWRTTGVVPFDEVAPAANLDVASPGFFTNVNLTESGFAVFSDDEFPVAGYAMQATSVAAALNWASAQSVKTSITTSSVFTFTISGVPYVVSPSTATATKTEFTDADLLSALLDPFNYIIDSVTVA